MWGPTHRIRHRRGSIKRPNVSTGGSTTSQPLDLWPVRNASGTWRGRLQVQIRLTCQASASEELFSYLSFTRGGSRKSPHSTKSELVRELTEAQVQKEETSRTRRRAVGRKPACRCVDGRTSFSLKSRPAAIGQETSVSCAVRRGWSIFNFPELRSPSTKVGKPRYSHVRKGEMIVASVPDV